MNRVWFQDTERVAGRVYGANRGPFFCAPVLSKVAQEMFAAANDLEITVSVVTAGAAEQGREPVGETRSGNRAAIAENRLRGRVVTGRRVMMETADESAQNHAAKNHRGVIAVPVPDKTVMWITVPMAKTTGVGGRGGGRGRQDQNDDRSVFHERHPFMVWRFYH